MRPMPKFTEILRNRNFFLLWLGQIISQLGDRLDQMALIGFVYLRTQGGAGSAMGIAKILCFTIIPVFLIGPFAGVYVDRWDRRRTMYICDLVRAMLVLCIPLFLFYSKNLVPVYCIIFLVFSIGRFFVPAKLAIVPDLVDKKNLLIANSLVNTTGMIASVLGFGVSGVLVEWLGAKSGFYLDSLSFLISGTLIFFIAKNYASSVTIKELGKEIIELFSASGKSVLQEIREGLVYFIKARDIRVTAGTLFVLWAALGAIYVVLIVFVQKALGTVTRDLGLLAMFLGIGLFLGSLVYGKFGTRLSHYKTIFMSLIASGVMVVLFAVVLEHFPRFSIAVALSLGLGMIVAPIMIASNTIIHKVSDNGMMGKVFSSLEIVMHFGFLVSMLVSSMLAERFPPGNIIVTVGIVVCLLGAVNMVVYRKTPWFN